MDAFTRLFGSLLVFVYHCFDRIVINGYLNGLSRPEQVVHFVRGHRGTSGQEARRTPATPLGSGFPVIQFPSIPISGSQEVNARGVHGVLTLIRRFPQLYVISVLVDLAPRTVA
jgi:hypothetical protein